MAECTEGFEKLFGTCDLGDYPQCLDKYEQWVRAKCGETMSGLTLRKTDDTYLFLKTTLPLSFLHFYFYLKNRIQDENEFEEKVLYILTDMLRPYIETESGTYLICETDEYDLLLLKFLLDQLGHGYIGLTVILYYSFYDGFYFPKRQLNQEFLRKNESAALLVAKIKKAFGGIIKNIPAEVRKELFRVYVNSPLSRVISVAEYDKYMKECYQDWWDISDYSRGLVFCACFDNETISAHKSQTEDPKPPIGQITAYGIGFGYGFVCRQKDGKYYPFDECADAYLNDRDLNESLGITWEEIDPGSFSLKAGDDINIVLPSILLKSSSSDYDTRIKCKVGNDFTLTYIPKLSRYLFVLEKISLTDDDVFCVVNIGEDYIKENPSSTRNHVIKIMESLYDAQGDDEFYTEEHLKKSIRSFLKSYMNAIEDDDDTELEEAKRLAIVIANSYKYQKNLMVLLSNESKLTEQRYFYIREFFAECIREYFQKHFFCDITLLDVRNDLCLYLGLYDQYVDPSKDFHDTVLLDHIEDKIFGVGYQFSFVHATQKIELFWFYAYTFLKYADYERVSAFGLTTLEYYWNILRLLMEQNDVTDKSIVFISRIIFTLWKDNIDYDPVVPYIINTLTFEQLQRVLAIPATDEEFSEKKWITDSLPDKGAYAFLLEKVEYMARKAPGGNGDRLRWLEAYFRLKLIKCSSIDDLIYEFIIMTNDIHIDKYYYASIILTVALDISKRNLEIDPKKALRKFIEVAIDGIENNESVLTRKSAEDIFKELQSINGGFYIAKIVLFTQYVLMNFQADGLEMIRMFSAQDILSTHLVILDQPTRIGAFRISNTRHDQQLNDEMGKQKDQIRRVSDAREDELLLIDSDFKNAIANAKERGIEASKIADIYFDTYLSCFIRLDMFNFMMHEVYGRHWDINQELQRRGGLISLCKIKEGFDKRYRNPFAIISEPRNLFDFCAEISDVPEDQLERLIRVVYPPGDPKEDSSETSQEDSSETSQEDSSETSQEDSSETSQEDSSEISQEDSPENLQEASSEAPKEDFSYRQNRKSTCCCNPGIRVYDDNLSLMLPDEAEIIKNDDGYTKLIIENVQIDEVGKVFAKVKFLNEGESDV